MTPISADELGDEVTDDDLPRLEDPSKMQDPDAAATHIEPLESQRDHQVSRTDDGKSLYGCNSGQSRPVTGQQNQYEICYNGQWWIMRCPGNGYFDIQLQVCVINTGCK